MTDTGQHLTADGFTGYTPDDLAWFATNYADVEWMVHVAGPDDCHTHANPDLDEDDPANPALTEATARTLAEGANRIGREYAERSASGEPHLPVAHATVFHRGVPVEPQPPIPPVRGFRVGDLVEITARVGQDELTPPGLRLIGRTGVVAELDAESEHPIGVAVDGWFGPAWCDSGEIRHHAARIVERATPDAPEPWHYTAVGLGPVCAPYATGPVSGRRLAFDPADGGIDCPLCRAWLAGWRAGNGRAS